MPADGDKIEIENVNIPGRTERLDRAKYEAVRNALVSVLPTGAPGLTMEEAKASLIPTALMTDLCPMAGSG